MPIRLRDAPRADKMTCALCTHATLCTGPRAPLPASTGVERTYYVAAEEVLWDYVPLGMDHCR